MVIVPDLLADLVWFFRFPNDGSQKHDYWVSPIGNNWAEFSIKMELKKFGIAMN